MQHVCPRLAPYVKRIGISVISVETVGVVQYLAVKTGGQREDFSALAGARHVNQASVLVVIGPG